MGEPQRLAGATPAGGERVYRDGLFTLAESRRLRCDHASSACRRQRAVKDVVQANLLAATATDAPGGTFNIARGERTTLLQLLTNLRDILEEHIEPIHEPPRAGDVRDSLADISEARNRLDFEPATTIAEGLRQSVEYYRSVV